MSRRVKQTYTAKDLDRAYDTIASCAPQLMPERTLKPEEVPSRSVGDKVSPAVVRTFLERYCADASLLEKGLDALESMQTLQDGTFDKKGFISQVMGE
ncbi:MAG: hypothetical protein MHM6MM_007090 [Cercozoa sp. M6MM]